MENLFTFPTPIPYLNTTITKGWWRGTVGADYCNIYYVLDSDAKDSIIQGNWSLDLTSFINWGQDNSLVTAALLAAAPWNVPLAPNTGS